MTTIEKRAYVRHMLECQRDDSLERTEFAFRGLTPEQMSGIYGQSGQTRQEILDGYRANRIKHEEVAVWLERLMA